MRAYERLLNYVRVHTTSDENSGTHPSAEREFDLARQLVEEMKALGMEDAHVDEHCYVYGTLPATPGCEDQHALGLIAHMDTADDASGENVQPVVWENYNGGDVTLPATGMVMKPSVFPFLTASCVSPLLRMKRSARVQSCSIFRASVPTLPIRWTAAMPAPLSTRTSTPLPPP